MVDILKFPESTSLLNAWEDGWTQISKTANGMFIAAGFNLEDSTRNAELLIAECRGYVAALEKHGLSKTAALMELQGYSQARSREMVGLPPHLPAS